jgi:RHS repeat-associated protein
MIRPLHVTPFGEQIAGASGTSHKFTEDERDSESNLDHTLFRQYSSSLARWMHPDPAGLAAVDPTNPQSWNRYAYVLNDPTTFVDPSGLVDCIDGHIGCNCNDPSGGCSGDFFGPHNPGNGCDPSDASCGGVGIGIGIGFGGGGGAGGGGGPITNPRPVTPGQIQLAQNPSDITCQYGFCTSGPQFDQSFLQVPMNPQVLDEGTQAIIRVLVWGSAIYAAAKAAVSNVHWSQHGPGNVEDTGIMNEVRALIKAGTAASVCAALDVLERAAKLVGDSAKLRKIRATQKAWGCRGSRQSR